MLNTPIEQNWVPASPHDITACIALGASEVVFEVLDTDRAIFGNTTVCLVRDCGIYVGKEPDTTLHWVSNDVETNGLQSNLHVVSGTISELRSERDFSRACSLGSFIDTNQAIDSRPDPPAGDGYYYLVNGTCAQPIGYGDSSLTPDMRDALPPTATCP